MISITTLVKNQTFDKIEHHTAEKVTTPVQDPKQTHILKALISKIHNTMIVHAQHYSKTQLSTLYN